MTARTIGVLTVALLLATSAVFAVKHRNWQEARVVKVGTQDTGQAVLFPVGGILVGSRLSQTNYYIETESILYVLATRSRKPLNLTVNGKTRIAVEGQRAYLLDDAGKEVKLPIVGKVAKPSKA